MHFNLFFWKEREREKEKEKRERINRGKKQGSRIRGKEGEGRKVGTKEEREGQKKEGSLNSSRWLLNPPSYSSPSSPNPFLLFPLYFTCNHRQALLLLNRSSCVQLCATPQMATHQAHLSPGFSRQEHQSGLPFLSPMHESEKSK